MAATGCIRRLVASSLSMRFRPKRAREKWPLTRFVSFRRIRAPIPPEFAARCSVTRRIRRRRWHSSFDFRLCVLCLFSLRADGCTTKSPITLIGSRLARKYFPESVSAKVQNQSQIDASGKQQFHFTVRVPPKSGKAAQIALRLAVRGKRINAHTYTNRHTHTNIGTQQIKL